VEQCSDDDGDPEPPQRWRNAAEDHHVGREHAPSVLRG
jgi:hypothetical protein